MKKRRDEFWIHPPAPSDLDRNSYKATDFAIKNTDRRPGILLLVDRRLPNADGISWLALEQFVGPAHLDDAQERKFRVQLDTVFTDATTRPANALHQRRDRRPALFVDKSGLKPGKWKQ